MPVLMEHSAESVASSYVKAGDLVRGHERRGQRLERAGVRDALMRPVPVVKLLELPQGMQEVGLVPDQRAVQELAAAGLHPALHDRVHSRHLDTAEHDLYACVLEYGIEQVGELAVAVTDQEPRSAVGVLEIHDEVLRGLGYPGRSGVGGGAQDPDAPAGVLDDRQDVQARAGQGDGLEEVAGEQSVGLGT